MDDVLFQSGDITITRSLAKFGNATYPIANIGSVVIEKDAPNLLGVIALVAIGGGIWVGSYAGWFVGLLVFGAVFALSYWVPEKRKLTLKTSSGDVTALSSSDTNLVEGVREAIERAFSR